MELKDIIIKFLQNVNKGYQATDLSTDELKVSLWYFAKAHLPALIGSGKFHTSAYFTQNALTKFEKVKKPKKKRSFQSIFGRHIKVKKWRLEFWDTEENETEATEKSTSYMGKEIRLIIDEFQVDNSRKYDEGDFTKNLYQDLEIK